MMHYGNGDTENRQLEPRTTASVSKSLAPPDKQHSRFTYLTSACSKSSAADTNYYMKRKREQTTLETSQHTRKISIGHRMTSLFDLRLLLS